MNTFADRLELAMKRAGLDPQSDQSELARRVGDGCKPQNIQYLLDKSKNAKASKYSTRIAEVLGVDTSWLAYGRGPAPGAKPVNRSNNAPKSGLTEPPKAGEQGRLGDDLPRPTEEEFAYVPQLDVSAACGEGRFQDHVVVKGGLAFKRTSLRDFGVPEHAARIIYASGGSMAPSIQDGCVVLINMADVTPVDGKVYLICKPDGGLVLKRLIRDYHPGIGAQAWIMRSDNPDKVAHPDKVLPPDDRTMIAGRAVWNDNRL